MTASPETIDLLLRRRSALALELAAPGPSDAELETLLACATRVSDHKKLAPWRIQILDRSAIDRLQALWLANYAGDPDKREKFERKLARTAPLLLIVSTRIVSDAAPRIEQVLSGGAVCQNLLIAAAALGYQSQWITGWQAEDPATKAKLGIAPGDDLLGYIYLGSAPPSSERPRPDLASVTERVTLSP